MCGIIGYIGNSKAKLILLDSLKRMEYRGYDSAGIAILENGKIESRKAVGRIENLAKNCKDIFDGSTYGIAHTRWATHGNVNETNAHPHFDCKKEIAVVHNGIIENYTELKQILASHKFESETDTEVIAHLIEELLKKEKNIEDALIKALKLVEGAYAIAIIYAKEPNKILVAKKSSPLVIGVGNEEMFVASDALAIMPYTNKVIFLKDNEIAIITQKDYTVKNLEKVKVNSEIKELKFKLNEASKDGYPDFMLKEIFEQPKTIKEAFKGRIDWKNATAKFGGINIKEKELAEMNRIILLGCGTSYHACLYGKYLFEELMHVPAQAEYASEFRYANPVIDEKTLVIVLSQSGETADVIAALKIVKKYKAKTLGIINVVASTIAREVDGGIYLHAGQEIAVASTKTFTSHIVVLYLLAIYLSRLQGKLSKEKAGKMLDELTNIPAKMQKSLENNKAVKEIAEKYCNLKNALYLARGSNYAIALEGALKLKEISYVHAEANPAAEMKHGPIALIDNNMFSVFIAPRDRLYKKILSNIEEIKSRKGKIIAITNEGNDGIKEKADDVIFIPETTEQLMPILAVIPLQLLAYHMAKILGRDIDKPRNLAKSVTVE